VKKDLLLPAGMKHQENVVDKIMDSSQVIIIDFYRSFPIYMGVTIKSIYCLNCVILREGKPHGRESGP
jgi:hypothetical protein